MAALDHQRTRRDGTLIFYRIDNNHVGQLVEDDLYLADHVSPSGRDAPDHHTLLAHHQQWVVVEAIEESRTSGICV